MINKKGISQLKAGSLSVMQSLSLMRHEIGKKNPGHKWYKETKDMIVNLNKVNEGMDLIEETLEALESSTKENKTLHTENFKLRNELDKLKRENEMLNKMSDGI